MDVTIKGEKYTPSDKANHHSQPVSALQLIHKGLSHIFEPIVKEFPDHDIAVSWNEDEKNLSYSSDTLDQSVIGDALKKYHGIGL